MIRKIQKLLTSSVLIFATQSANSIEAEVLQSNRPSAPANSSPIQSDTIKQPSGTVKIDGNKIKKSRETPTIDVNKTTKTPTKEPEIDGSSASPDGTIGGIGTSPTLTPTPK